MLSRFTIDDFNPQIKIIRKGGGFVEVEDNFNHKGTMTFPSNHFSKDYEDSLILREIINNIAKNNLWLTKEFMKEKGIDLNKNNWWG